MCVFTAERPLSLHARVPPPSRSGHGPLGWATAAQLGHGPLGRAMGRSSSSSPCLSAPPPARGKRGSPLPPGGCRMQRGRRGTLRIRDE